jgi:hypothetical protein
MVNCVCAMRPGLGRWRGRSMRSAQSFCEENHRLTDETAQRRVFSSVRFPSMPGDIWLTDKHNDLKWAIVEEIEKLRDEAQVFVGPGGGQGLPTGKGGSLGGCDDVMRRCVGAAILDFPKWRFSIDDRDFRQLCPVAVEQRRNHACTTTIVVGVPVTWHPRTDPFVTGPFVSHSRTRL